MQKFPPGNTIKALINLVDASGAALSASALRWRLLDENDSVLIAWQTAAVPGAGAPLELTIPSALTLLTPPQTRMILRLEVEVTHAGGIKVIEQSSMVMALSTLVPGHNSFQTYSAARVMGISMPGGSRWELEGEVTKEEHEVALSEAFAAIMRLPLKVTYDSGRWAMLKDLVGDDMIALLPAQMLKDLRKAQVLEAVSAIDADPLLLQRRRGLISMTVGESSQFFGSKPVDTPVLNQEVYKVLGPYIHASGVKIGRA